MEVWTTEPEQLKAYEKNAAMIGYPIVLAYSLRCKFFSRYMEGAFPYNTSKTPWVTLSHPVLVTIARVDKLLLTLALIPMLASYVYTRPKAPDATSWTVLIQLFCTMLNEVSKWIPHLDTSSSNIVELTLLNELDDPVEWCSMLLNYVN